MIISSWENGRGALLSGSTSVPEHFLWLAHNEGRQAP